MHLKNQATFVTTATWQAFHRIVRFNQPPNAKPKKQMNDHVFNVLAYPVSCSSMCFEHPVNASGMILLNATCSSNTMSVVDNRCFSEAETRCIVPGYTAPYIDKPISVSTLMLLPRHFFVTRNQWVMIIQHGPC